MKREYFSHIYHVLDMWHSFFQLCVGGCDHFLAGCGWLWVFTTFIWLGIGGCDFFWLGVSGCGWVWPVLTGCVGVGQCDLFLAGCGWVWVSVTYFWLGVGWCGWVWPFFGLVWVSVSDWVGVGECVVYNYPFFYVYPWSSRTEFLTKLIASDLRMLRIIQQ